MEMWWRRAACAEEDPELFFPVGTSGPAEEDLLAAKRVCHRCPVIKRCRNWALETGQASGVWGGMGEDERSRWRHRTRRAEARSRPVKN